MSERGKIALQCLEVGRNHRTCGGMDAAINKIENLQARLDGLLTEYRLVLDKRDKHIEELEAKIKRTKALPKKWRKHSFDNPKAKTFMDAGDCADELETALKEPKT